MRKLLKSLFGWEKITIAGLLLSTVFSGPLMAKAGNAVISNFETGTGGWNNGAIVSGYNSNGALRLSNIANGAVGSTKALNAPILRGYQAVEFDLNLHGAAILDGDAAALVFDQGGWKLASLKGYVQNGQQNWQHVVIPFSSVPGLNSNGGIASLTFRFWNFSAGSYDIDNIILSNNTVGPPPPPPEPEPVSNIIANFDSGMNGFDHGSPLLGFLRLTNSGYGDASTKKMINAAILKGYTTLEFDININGNQLLNGDAGTIFFDQAGLRAVTIRNYLNNGQNGWQHVKIALSDFTGLKTDQGIASISFRFWNYTSGNYDLDNIALSNGGGTPPIQMQTPSNLTGNIVGNGISLAWNGNGPLYIVFRNSNEIARTGQPNYTDMAATTPGMTYSYFIKATDGTTITPSSNNISIAIPADPGTPTTSWSVKSIDSQVASKYWSMSDPNQIKHLVDADKSLGAKHIAVSINFDNYTLLKQWADIIHNDGLNVWFRGHWNDWDTWEQEGKKTGITNIEYLNRTKNFIIAHPDLFRAGDAFTMCVESENAAWWTGIDRGPFTGWESWRTFTRNQVSYANDAFSIIGLGGKVKTNWINMNGWVAWNEMDQYTANTIGQLTLDHIIDWTDDTNIYTNALFKGNGSGFYGYDEYYNKWHVPLMAGEWGYSTFNQNIDPNHQKELAEAVFSEFAKRSYIAGVNYWIDAGHASRLFDSGNLLDYIRRPIADVIEHYYK